MLHSLFNRYEFKKMEIEVTILKKILICINIILLSLTLSGCNKSTDNDQLVIDYNTAEEFENALNNDEEVDDKVVKFEVNEYKEDSILGINCWAGEHLNFISEEALDVKKGDYVIGRVIDTPSKVLGSWKIPYEVIDIEYTEEDEENDEDSDVNIQANENIIITFDSNSYVGKNYKDVVSQLKDLGFTDIEANVVNTSNSNHQNNAISSILIDGLEFNKGDTFNKKAKVEIGYWKYKKPDSEYELAFVRKLSSYDLYYMFDTDKKKVIYFGTNDTSVSKGTYKGSFSSGVIINWNHGEFKEKFIYEDDASYAVLIDGNGFDWDYETCDLKEAQQVLDSLQ